MKDKLDPNTKYNRNFTLFNGLTGEMDFYAIIAAFPELPEEIKHALKKLLYLGVRDKGTAIQDAEEAGLSISKYLLRINRESKSDSKMNGEFHGVKDREPVKFGPPPVHLLKTETPPIMPLAIREGWEARLKELDRILSQPQSNLINFFSLEQERTRIFVELAKDDARRKYQKGYPVP